MQIKRKYKSGYSIRLAANGIYWVYGPNNIRYEKADNFEDARFIIWCATH